MAPPLINPLKNGASSPSKERGAYYTSETVADFLVRWAIRSGRETVLDPSFGGGVFLHAAGKRLRKLRGNPAKQIFGIELDSNAHVTASSELEKDWQIPLENLWVRDFFDVEPLPKHQVDAVVGNPPYIRYQRFTDDVRQRALARAAEQGVRLTQLSSSWAPFVIHAVAMIKDGGKLAMVLPGELGYAKYAAPVLEYLTRSFGQITLLTFKKKLFTEINEDTVLLLAEAKGESSSSVRHRDFVGESSLQNVTLDKSYTITKTQRIPTSPILERQQRLIEYLLPKKTRELYSELKRLDRVARLGDLADVGIGYVTGANDFFHLSPKQVSWFKIPARFLRNAVKRSKAFHGLEFTQQDWDSALAIGESGYLLYIGPASEIPKQVANYLREGQERGVPNAYKCRTRKPWYSVPHVYEPDGFLSYMSTGFPSLVANRAGAVAPNTLHILRLHEATSLSSSDVAASWPTSLSRLSVEIEGHSLGGGMLKLEPTEAEKCLVAVANGNGNLVGLAEEMDSLMREGCDAQATELADRKLLRDSLALTERDCRMLSEGAKLLRGRRTTRSGRT